MTEWPWVTPSGASMLLLFSDVIWVPCSVPGTSVRRGSGLKDLLTSLGESGCALEKLSLLDASNRNRLYNLGTKEGTGRIWSSSQTPQRSCRLPKGQGLWGSRQWE